MNTANMVSKLQCVSEDSQTNENAAIIGANK